MTRRTLFVVHRPGEQILLMLPQESETDARHYALVSEDESFAAAAAIRHVAVTRDNSVIEVGELGDKLRIEHVDHGDLPFEIIFDHVDGTTVIDLRRDEALTFADMLWGAHRGLSFYMSVALTAVPRHREAPPQNINWGQTPRQDMVSRLLGNTQRRVRGENPKAKE